VTYNDPHVPVFHVGGDAFHRENVEMESCPLSEGFLAQQDCVVIVAGHTSHDYAWIAEHASLIVDCVNATRGTRGDGRTLRVGAPLPKS